jgi:hypothetical protein
VATFFAVTTPLCEAVARRKKSCGRRGPASETVNRGGIRRKTRAREHRCEKFEVGGGGATLLVDVLLDRKCPGAAAEVRRGGLNSLKTPPLTAVKILTLSFNLLRFYWLLPRGFIGRWGERFYWLLGGRGQGRGTGRFYWLMELIDSIGCWGGRVAGWQGGGKGAILWDAGTGRYHWRLRWQGGRTVERGRL